MLQGINHTCIAVNDMDRSVAFYRDVVGAEVGPELDYKTVICIPLRIGKDTLELMKVLNVGDKNLQVPLEPGQKGNVHVCIQVDDVDTHAKKVRDSGVEITADVHEMNVGKGKIKNFYFRDPDGHALQFLQIL